MSDTPSDRPEVEMYLSALVVEHGEDLCMDHRRVARLLAQTYPERPVQCVALHVAVREGVAADLSKGGGIDVSPLIFERMSRRLFDRAGLAPEHANWAVAVWAAALGKELPKRGSRLRSAPSLQPVSPEPVSGPVGAPWMMKGHRRAISCVAFSGDGAHIVTSSLDRTVRIWDGRSGEPISVLLGGHRDWIRSVAFSPDGKTVASGGDDGAIRLWDVKTGERRYHLSGHDDWVRSVAFSPDGRIVASGGRDGAVVLWEVSSLQLLARLDKIPGGVSRLAFDPGGAWLAVGALDVVQIWDLERLRCRTEIPAKGPRPVVSAGRGGKIVIGDDAGVAIHNVSDGGEASRFEGHEGAVRVVALHPNGKSLATGGQDQTVRIWNTAWGWETWRVETGRRVTGLCFHPQGHLVMGFSDGNAELWEMQHG